MNAIVFNPDKKKLEIEEWPYPTINSDEVIVKIHAAALNHRDINLKNSPYIQDKFVFGSDAAGKVVEVGNVVTNVKIGDEVLINTFISCMKCENCIKGEHTLCVEGRVLGGLSWDGTFAEYVKVPSRNVEMKPSHLDFIQSAALPLSFGTAWRALTHQAKIKPSDTVFIQGIGGGVSLYCLQIAVNLGCKVVVTSSSEDKIRAALEMGAYIGINYKTEDVLEKVQEITDIKDGFDIIISSYGGSVPLSMEVAKVGGKIIQFAYLGKTLESFDIDKLMGKQLSLIGTGDQTYQEFKEALNFIDSKKITPTISQTYKFEDYEKAFRLMEEGKQFGKIIIEINQE